MTTDTPAEGMLGHAQVSAKSRAGRYIAHIAVGCRNVAEAARWYAEVRE